jgi:hypothetical protein
MKESLVLLRENSITEMASRAVNKRENKTRSRKLLDTGWTRIPNCFKFELKIGPDCPQWKRLGIEKKTTLKKKVTPYINEPMNKYMKFQIRRLQKIKYDKDHYRYWKIVWCLLKHSKSFRVSAIQHVFTNWYKNVPYWQILKWNAMTTKIFENWDDNLTYKRVYIPKGDTHRPLGVPSPEWRLALHMFNNFLQTFTSHQVLDSQHGFIPGRGCLTAWREVFKKIIGNNYIYECDLKQFFPSVHVNTISEVLEKYRLPKRIMYWLENINRCLPEFPLEQKLDESKYIMTAQDQEDIKKGYFRWESKLYDPIRHLVGANTGTFTTWEGTYTADGWGLLHSILEEEQMNLFEFVQMQWALFDSHSPTTMPGHFVGVPQGAPTSPLTSILTLREFLTQVPSISYADDPIFYNENDFSVKGDPNKGIHIHEGKSRFIKRGGQWLETLKYLGMEYNPFTDTFSGNTRKGSRLELTREYRNKILDIFKPRAPRTWESLFSIRDIGLLFSRLYIGSWSSDDLSTKQDFKLKCTKHSLGDIVYNKFNHPILRKEEVMNTFNISSFACQLLSKKLASRKGINKKTVRFHPDNLRRWGSWNKN